MKYTVRVTKCYFTEILDQEGNTVKVDYVFGNKKDAEEIGKEYKKEMEEKENVRITKESIG